MAKWSSFVWGDGTKWGHAAADYPHRVPLTIKIAGTDRTDSIDPSTVLIEEIATKQDSRASLIIKNGGSMNLAELDAIIIAGWEQEHEFAGYIWKLEELARGVQLDYRVDCTDYTWDLQHPEALVDEKYTSKSDQYIIQDFMATSCPGIEVTTYVEEVNSDTVSVSFDNEIPFAVIERLAEDAGAEWYVDFGPVAGDPTKWAYLHYFDSGTNAAPYSLSDSPDLSASFPYKSLSEFVEAPLANKVVVIGRDLTVTRTTGAESDYGRWLVAKLVNLDITTTAQANSVGDQFLTEVAATASYRLDAHEPGLRAGQNVTFVNAIRGVNDSFMIMSLSKRFERAGLAAYTVQLGKYIPSLAAIIVSDSDAGGLTGTVVADAIKADLGVFDELLLYLDEGDPILGFNIDGIDLFTLGIDDSDYDTFKLNDGDSLAGYSLFELASDCVMSLTADGADPQAELRLKTYSAAITNASLLGFQKSHDDTAGTKTETINNDRLGTIAFYGVDTGGNFDIGALIQVLQDGSAGTTIPAEIVFTTYNNSSANSPITMGSDGSLQIHGQQELRFYDNGNYVGFEAPALGADQIWALPTADGTSGQYLKTDGTGSLGWATAAGAGDVLGPGSSTDHAIARWNGTSGGAIQDSGIIVDDSNNLVTPGTIKVGTTASACDASHRGVIKFIEGGAGVADHLWVCEKDASDNYNWVTIGSEIGGHAHRKNLTVSAASGNGVSAGYSVKFTASGADAADIYNDSLASGNDFRTFYFTGSGWQELDRDLVTFSDSEIEVWFKLQVDIAAGASDNDYYAYYGKSGAGSPPANKANVYWLYDDFPGTSLDGSKWGTIIEGSGTVTVGDGYLKQDSVGSVAGHTAHVYSQTNFAIGFYVKFRLDLKTAANDQWQLSDVQGHISSYGIRYSRWDQKHQKVINGAYTDVATDITMGAGVHTVELAADQNGGAKWILDGTSYSSTGLSASSIKYAFIYCGGSQGRTEIWHDWILIRDYVATEPTVSAGSEQSGDI